MDRDECEFFQPPQTTHNPPGRKQSQASFAALCHAIRAAEKSTPAFIVTFQINPELKGRARINYPVHTLRRAHAPDCIKNKQMMVYPYM